MTSRTLATLLLTAALRTGTLRAATMEPEFRTLWPDSTGFDDHGRGEGSPREWPEGLEKIGGAKGSNPGGLYKDASGQKWYVKHYADSTQAASEQIANDVYRAVGIGVPESVLGEGGKYASKWEDGGKTLAHHGLDKETAGKVLEGYAADAFLANWDTVGTGHDNILVTKGGVRRIDQGGTLLHRAQGALKPEAGLDKLGEWRSLASDNPWYRQVFKAAGVKDADSIKSISKQVDRILAARPANGGWKAFVDKSAPKAPAAYRERVGRMLEARHAILAEKATKLKGLADFDESKHPRDDDGKFTDGGGGGKFEEGGTDVPVMVKKKSAPATKDQIEKIVEMKKAGHSYAKIHAETGINPKQAATIMFKQNKIEKALESEKNIKTQISTKKIDEPITKTEPIAKPTSAPVMDKNDYPSFGPGSITGNAVKAGFIWQEKTPANSPSMDPKNTGKYAWFKDGKQASGPFAKDKQEEAAASIHQGKGPTWKPPVAVPEPEKKLGVVEKGAGGEVTHWPIADSTSREIGTKYPIAVEAHGAKWQKTLSDAEKNAIHSYTGSGYSTINSVLRQHPDSPLSGNASKIASAISKHPDPPPPELVWRGIGSKGAKAFAGKLESGDIIRMDGFQSTSIDPGFASHWGGASSNGVLFEIKPAKGAYVHPLSSHWSEKEYLLPHGAKYTVRGHAEVKIGGTKRHVVQLEMHK